MAPAEAGERRMQSVILATQITVEEFYQRRDDLPEGGRWCELVQGRVVEYTPPDPLHSGVVLNVAKELGMYAMRTGNGYACFDLGLVVGRAPDTVRVANIAYFVSGPRFAYTDAAFAETAPELVIKLASSADRRESMHQRVAECLAAGVRQVWVLDTKVRVARVHRPKGPQQTVPSHETLSGADVLPGFACEVGPLFDVPEW
jgi:Uma2 family endonuclease